MNKSSIQMNFRKEIFIWDNEQPEGIHQRDFLEYIFFDMENQTILRRTGILLTSNRLKCQAASFWRQLH